MVCSGCGSELSAGARFCSACGRPAMGVGFVPAQSRLVRPRAGRAIGGVCASFAIAYGWDVVVVRLVFCLLALFGAGTPILVYLIAWVIIPNEPVPAPQQMRTWPTPPDATVP